MRDFVGWSIFRSDIAFVEIAAIDRDALRPADNIRPRDSGRDGLEELVVIVGG